MTSKRTGLYIVIFCLTLVIVRWFFPERSLTYSGLRSVMDTVFSLGLLSLVILTGGALGLKVQRRLRLQELTALEQALFGISLGLGIIAYGIFFLGMAGLLSRVYIFIWSALVVGLSLREMGEILSSINQWSRGFSRRVWAILKTEEKILLIIGALILTLTLAQSLTPPWDYDGLIYHLQGPRLFLQASRIPPQVDNVWVYYPFTTEMLFTLGMSFGSDNFAKLIHLSFSIILVFSTFAFGKRYLGRSVGVLATAIMIGIPILPIWASFAYNDIPWAVYEFLAVYAVFLWLEEWDRKWLVIAGIFMGLALGTKYMALGGGAVLGLWILWYSRSRGWRTILGNGAVFAGIALLVGSPWYLKNWIWTGNPVYPFFFTSREPVAGQVSLWMAYMNGFGAGKSWLDYLLLPIRLYTQYDRFGTFLGSIEVLSFLFPLLLLYPWTRKSSITNGLILWLTMRFVIWAIGVQQIRYLLPLFPALCLLTSHVLVDLVDRMKQRASFGRILSSGLVFGMVAATLTYSILFFAMVSPLKVILGIESKEAFLDRMLPLFEVTQFIETRLPEQARVMMLWDGRGYYCDQRCLPDFMQSQWTYLVSTGHDVKTIALKMKDQGVSSLLYSQQDMTFISQHDVSGKHLEAARFLVKEFIPACTRQIYKDDYYELLELTCP